MGVLTPWDEVTQGRLHSGQEGSSVMGENGDTLRWPAPPRLTVASLHEEMGHGEIKYDWTCGETRRHSLM